MSPKIHTGKLLRWNDDRGFGFIASKTDPQGIFLHISALGRIPRRPKVGDIIVYQRVVQADGRVKAEQASIKGLSSTLPLHRQPLKPRQTRRAQSHQLPSRLSRRAKGLGIILCLLPVAAVCQQLQQPSSTAPPVPTAIGKPDCNIKGNISVSSGKKWYHVPGMEDYDDTIIDTTKGEKWFCSEDEAIAAGWKKAPQ